MSEGILVFFLLLLGLAGFVFWVWALVDAVRVPTDAMYSSGSKLIWVLVIVLLQFLGAIIYVAVGRPPGGAKAAIQRSSTAAHDDPTPPPA
jgi:hypothetical protein